MKEDKAILCDTDNMPVPIPISAYVPQFSLYQVMLGGFVANKRYENLQATYKMVERAYERYKMYVIRDSHSNNWLRLHGYPMKRKQEKDRLC